MTWVDSRSDSSIPFHILEVRSSCRFGTAVRLMVFSVDTRYVPEYLSLRRNAIASRHSLDGECLAASPDIFKIRNEAKPRKRCKGNGAKEE